MIDLRADFRATFLLLAISTALLLVGCGGGGGSDGGSQAAAGANVAPATGQVGLLITDAPSDEFAAIEVTVSEIELLGDERVTIFTGMETFDLLQLENYTDLFLVAQDVPAGFYDKIRLTVEELVLVREVDDGQGGVDIEEERPRLPGNGKLDLNPRGSFEVVGGELLLIEIDMDANKSIKAHESGNGEWRFRPVVFVKIVSEMAELEKLGRVSGEIRELSDEQLLLCALDVNSGDGNGDSDSDSDSEGGGEREDCLAVNLFDGLGVFDAEGDSVGTAALMLGEQVTVVGRFFSAPAEADDDSDSASDSDSDAAENELKIQLDAIVIEIGPAGTFASIAGEVDDAIDPATDRFDLLVDDNQGFVMGTLLAVQLQDGTAIISPDGELLDDSDVGATDRAEVDGVLQLAMDEPDLLKAALVLLESNEPDASEFNGVIEMLDVDARRFDLRSETAVECVDVPADAVILLITEEADGAMSERVDLDALSDGQRADVTGEFGTGSCVVADIVVAFEDLQAPTTE